MSRSRFCRKRPRRSPHEHAAAQAVQSDRGQDLMDRLRYALLVLPAGGGPSDVRNMEDEKTTFVSRLSALVENDELGRWQEWLGTVEWNGVDGQNRHGLPPLPVAGEAP